jgi:hypothetical protein
VGGERERERERESCSSEVYRGKRDAWSAIVMSGTGSRKRQRRGLR